MDDSLSENAPSAQGTFAKTPLAHVLVHALHQQLTGTFELALRGSPSGTFLVVEGHPAKARTMVDHYLLRVMQQVGVLSEGQVHNWLPRLLMSEELHGRALVRKGVLTEEQVELGLRAQLVRQMQSIVELPPDTTWKYFDGVDALAGWGEESPVRLDPHPFVWSSLKQAPPWEHVNAALAKIEGAWLRVADDAETNAFNLDKAQRAVVELLRQKPWPLGALVAASSFDADTVRLLVYCLMLAKSVELVDAAEAAEQATPMAPEVAPVEESRPVLELEPDPSAPDLSRATPTGDGDDANERMTRVPDESVVSAREAAPVSVEVVSVPSMPEPSRGAPSSEDIPSRRPTPRGLPRVVEPEDPLPSAPLLAAHEAPRTPVPEAPPTPPRAAHPSARAKDPPTLVPRTPPPPAPAARTPVPVPPPYPGRRKDPPTLVSYHQEIPAAAHPTPLQMTAVRASPMMPTGRRPKDPPTLVPHTEKPPPPVFTAPGSPATKPPPPDLEEPGYDIPVRPLAPPKPVALDDDDEHNRPTAVSMAAVTPEQVAAYIASLEEEKTTAVARPPTPATFPKQGRPLPPPPPVAPRPFPRVPRPATPMVFREPPDREARAALVPPAPSPVSAPEGPPRATGAATTVARPAAPPGAVDISDKADERPSQIPPLSTRKTLEVPIDRALVDATVAAASSRMTVEVVPSRSPAAPVPPAPTPSSPLLDFDSPFDAGWDDAAPPPTPVREVSPDVAEEASGKKPK